MEHSPIPKASGIPRPSRLPVPKASIRPVPSKDDLHAPRSSISNPRMRHSASRDQLSSLTASKNRGTISPLRNNASTNSSRDRNVSTGTVIHTPSSSQKSGKLVQDSLLRKPPGLVLECRSDSEDSGEDTLIIEKPGERTQNSRLSLSERTMETLQNIPSSPAVRKRGSSFFNSENSASSPIRLTTSRPSSSSGPGKSGPTDFRASTNTFKPLQSMTEVLTPVKRQIVSKSSRTHTNTRSTAAPIEMSSSRLPAPKLPEEQVLDTPSKSTYLKAGSRSVTSRPLKPRASINGLFRKPSAPISTQSGGRDELGTVYKKRPAATSDISFSGSSETTTTTTPKGSPRANIMSVASADHQEQTPRKSSLALRDQIAKAKAAKRATSSKQIPDPVSNREETPVIPSDSFDFDLPLPSDPFNQRLDPNGSKGLLRKRVAAARLDGRLNVAAMGLKEIPVEVMNMYNLESIGVGDGSWAEAVDLTRFIAADNDLTALSDDIFPDVDPREAVDEDDAKGCQFGGLQMLDMHGNVLNMLPIGLRRLELLTTLNLSYNKLENDCLTVISQISSLRDLKLAGNQLKSELDPSIGNLVNLEELDLRQNSLSSLPHGIAELVQLRILNIAENEFTSLPFTSISKLPLTQLLAAKNKLTGTLIGDSVDELSNLQILDVTANSLTSLHDRSDIQLPALYQMSCSANRLSRLPDIKTWLSLLTIFAADNNIEDIPESFVELQKVKNVDFSGNNIKALDDRIGGMDSLEILRINGNPLRERKFAGMSTEDLKRALRARMEPTEAEVQPELDPDEGFYSAPASPSSTRPDSQPGSSGWAVQPGGVLDRSNTKLHSFNPVAAANTAAVHQVRILELHHNMFKQIPDSIAFFAQTLTTLSLSHNELTSDTFMKDDLELPALKALNLSSNTFNSLQPLILHLRAPMLERLDLSFNRLTSLPVMRTYFPCLISLMASHNTIKELLPETIKGLRVVDLSSNELNSLNARIGLLGGPGGLEKLDVSGNRFRVPKYTILEKGTEATLAWLRDRIPASDVSSGDQDVD